jgi:H+/Cl- antiporter ClcA
VVTCIAGALLPFRAKALYEASPGAKYKLGDIPLITVLGVLGGVLGIFMVVSYLAAPQLGVLGSWDFSSFPGSLLPQIIAIGLIVISWVWYAVAKNNQKSKGIDVDFAFKEIPPE